VRERGRGKERGEGQKWSKKETNKEQLRNTFVALMTKVRESV
jgi:hypothetical protein